MKGIPMQTGVLRVLRAIAASWWRHKELRRTGQSARARQDAALGARIVNDPRPSRST